MAANTHTAMALAPEKGALAKNLTSSRGSRRRSSYRTSAMNATIDTANSRRISGDPNPRWPRSMIA
jgi:hypothetical protein